jgi:hypothetical protein
LGEGCDREEEEEEDGYFYIIGIFHFGISLRKRVSVRGFRSCFNLTGEKAEIRSGRIARKGIRRTRMRKKIRDLENSIFF